MIVTESSLRDLIREEIKVRFLEEIMYEELFKLILEQNDDKDISDEEFISLYKKKPSFRKRVKQAFDNFDALPSLKKKAAIVAMGMIAAAGTDFASKTAAQAQADQLAAEFRADQKSAAAEHFGTLEDLHNFRDAAVKTAEGTIIGPQDIEAIQKTKDRFMSMGVEGAPIIGDRGLGMSTGEQRFVYTPADNIPDNEVLPFVGMTKKDWEKVIRRWLTSPDGRDDIEKFIGTKGRGHAIFWAYGPRGELFSHAFDEAAPGQRGMWLPPEWSVAYDVVQKNKARAGNQPSPEDDLNIPTAGSADVWKESKESLRKYLQYILSVL